MIDVKELRIDNLVMCKNEICRINMINRGDVVEVSTIDSDSVKECFACEIMSDRLYPIILTEELALKCGFKKINHVSGYSFFSMERKKYGANIDIYEAYSTIGGNTSVPHIQFLHQLQNLYFALTGNELKIEL